MPTALYGLAYDVLGETGVVGVCGVDEVDALLIELVDNGNARLSST
jgi:hypothetical protein